MPQRREQPAAHFSGQTYEIRLPDGSVKRMPVAGAAAGSPGAPLDRERAERFAERWYAAWNAHDLDAILEHYADDVEMASPLVAALAGRENGRIAGKEALRAYFAAGLERYPELRFEPIDLFVGVDSLVLQYRSVGGRLSAEVVFLDGEDRIVRYCAHYA
jgi:ketosteroid isomerase-like protein